MIVWTIQKREVYDELLSSGIYYTKEPDFTHVEEFRYAYDWLVPKMIERIGKPPYEGIKYPVWSWYHYSPKYKPDLRYSEFKYHKYPQVRLELEIPDNQIVLSDFDLWGSVICYWKICHNYKQSNLFDEIMKRNLGKNQYSFSLSNPAPSPFHEEIVESWDHIFDMTYTCQGYAKGFSDKIPENKSVQGTFWYISKDMIRDYTFFPVSNKETI